jgi:hypothetical protein
MKNSLILKNYKLFFIMEMMCVFCEAETNFKYYFGESQAWNGQGLSN